MWNSLLSFLTVRVSLCLPFSCCCGLSRNRVFNFLGYMQFVLTRMYKSQGSLDRGGHESVENWTIGSGHRVPLLSLTVSYYPVAFLAVTLPFLQKYMWSYCTLVTVVWHFGDRVYRTGLWLGTCVFDPLKHQGAKVVHISACCCAVQVAVLCDQPALGMFTGTVVLVFLPLSTATS